MARKKTFTPQQVEKIATLWHAGVATIQIAAKLKESATRIKKHAAAVGLPKRKVINAARQRVSYPPRPLTPELRHFVGCLSGAGFRDTEIARMVRLSESVVGAILKGTAFVGIDPATADYDATAPKRDRQAREQEARERNAGLLASIRARWSTDPTARATMAAIAKERMARARMEEEGLETVAARVRHLPFGSIFPDRDFDAVSDGEIQT